MLKSAAARCLRSPVLNLRLLSSLPPTFLSSLPPTLLSSLPSFSQVPPAAAAAAADLDIDPKDIADSFKEWFLQRDEDTALFERIFKILTTHDDAAVAGAALSSLNLRLTEHLVLGVLRHGRQQVLPCLKFFDWAGHQRGFRHTSATFHAIFKILSRARLVSVIFDWLQVFSRQRYSLRVRFYDTLVMGYAVAGKPETALSLFGKMRFQGLDLDYLSYHVLLNALIEESWFEAAEVISRQISMRGFENVVTCYLRLKNLCKQKKLEEAETYLRELGMSEGFVGDQLLGFLVGAFCKQRNFVKALELIEEFGKSGNVRMGPAYGVWIRELVDARQVDTAVDFLQKKTEAEGYIPEIFCYNKLIYGLLKQNKLDEVYDLFVEMREGQISPDRLTMNAALCFFCKAGMVDVAVELYNSRKEIDLTPNSLAFNCLIDALMGDGSTDEACHVLEDYMKQGYFPGRRTFDMIADALCREGKLDKMNKLMDVAMEKNIKPSDAVCVQYISALCYSGKSDDGYMVSLKLNEMSNLLNTRVYANLIRGFSKLRRGDMASRLLIEMVESGLTPRRGLYSAVITCLCDLGELNIVLNLLEVQLSSQQEDRHIYNYFIHGAGHGKKPELAREVFERMVARGILPSIDTKILMLQSYLKSNRIGDALNFFDDLCRQQEPSTKLYNTMIVGLCKAERPEPALFLWREVRDRALIPSLQSYEELVHALCSCGDYVMAVKILDDFEGTGRQVSSFICNVLLLHTLKGRELLQAWHKVERECERDSRLRNSKLGILVSLFCGGIRMEKNVNNLDALIEKLFPVNIYTYNMLLRAITMEGKMDHARRLFDRIKNKGCKPNRWTYDIIVHAFCKLGRRKDAETWMEEMYQKGFYPTWCTIKQYNNMEARRT